MENIEPDAPFSSLSARESQVARFLCIGHNNREIAKILDISVKTVDTHRMKVMKKTGAANNVMLLILALRKGFVAPGFVTQSEVGA